MKDFDLLHTKNEFDKNRYVELINDYIRAMTRGSEIDKDSLELTDYQLNNINSFICSAGKNKDFIVATKKLSEETLNSIVQGLAGEFAAVFQKEYRAFKSHFANMYKNNTLQEMFDALEIDDNSDLEKFFEKSDLEEGQEMIRFEMCSLLRDEIRHLRGED